MRKPPPNKKGLANVNLIVESLPDRGRSSWHLGAVWALSQYQENEVGKAHRQQTTFTSQHRHTSKTIKSLIHLVHFSFPKMLSSASECTSFFLPFSLWRSSRLNNRSCLTLSAAVPGNVSWWALHREAGEGCHGKVQEGAGRDNQLHQEEERGKEATILQHVSWQNPKQCCSLRIQKRLI